MSKDRLKGANVFSMLEWETYRQRALSNAHNACPVDIASTSEDSIRSGELAVASGE